MRERIHRRRKGEGRIGVVYATDECGAVLEGMQSAVDVEGLAPDVLDACGLFATPAASHLAERKNGESGRSTVTSTI